MRRLTAHKARPRPWPAGSGDTTGLEKPAQGNRRWHSWIYHGWKDTLTPTDRAAWIAAAPDFTIKNNKGLPKTPNGYQLFTWWHSYEVNTGWQPLTPFDPTAYTLTIAPPNPAWTKPTVSNIAVTSTSPTLDLNFDCDLDATKFAAWIQITPPRRKPTPYPKTTGSDSPEPYQ